MKSFTRYSLYALAAVILVMAGLAVYLLSHKDQIKRYALEQVNAQLDAELQVGTFDLTLLSQFPKVSLDMGDVTIADPLHRGKLLLKADHVFIGFNLYDILRKNYVIKLVAIDNGEVRLLTDKKGRVNYSIMKDDGPETGNEKFLLNLKEVKLNQVKLHYLDDRYRQYYDLLLDKVTLHGDFSDRGERIALEGKLLAHRIQSQDMVLLKDKKLAADVLLRTDHQSNTYVFEKGHIDIDRLKLTLQGRIVNKPKSVSFDLQTSARQLDIPSLLSLLPNQGSWASDLKSTGEIYLDGSIKGEADNKQSPAIRFRFGIRNGSLQRGNGLAMENIQAEGELGNGSARNLKTAFIRLSSLSLVLNKGQVTGRVEVTNLSDPQLDAKLKGNMEAADLLRFLKNETIKDASGTIAFDIDFSGKTAHLNSAGWLRNKASGNLKLDLKDITFTQNDKTIKRLSVDLSLHDKDAMINDFVAEVDQSDVKITGKIGNLVPYLLVTDQPMQADITYQSNYIDLNNFMMPLSPANMDPGKRGFALPSNILIDARVKAQEVIYGQFKAKNVTASLRWKGKQIAVEDLNAQTLDGHIKLDGQIENAPDGRFLVSTTSELRDINIQSLFRTCNDFGQKEITQQHLRGKLTGTIDLVSVWSNNLDCDLSKLYTLAKIRVSNGELNGYKPIESLARFIDVNELRNLKFADLDNTIEVKNRTIYIPAFDIKNNALNLSLSGTHTLDNYIDYKVKIKLSEYLKKKRKPAANEFNEEETADGGMNLYLSIRGPIDNFKISYDQATVKQQIKQDLRKEKQNIRQVLQKEMGLDEEKKKEIREKKDDSDELEFEAE